MAISKPRDLSERTFLFASDIMALCMPLARIGGAHRMLSGQLLRAGTSVGANAEEASAAYGRRDFGYRNAVVLREARESRFWLRLIAAHRLAPLARIKPLLVEATELVAIYTTVVRKVRQPRREKGRRFTTE